MPLPRTLDNLHKQYTRQAQAKEPPTKSLRTIRDWSCKKKWAPRVQDYDADATAIATEKTLQLHAEHSIANVERFNKEVLNSGRNGLLLCAGLKASIRRFAMGSEGMPPPRKGEQPIKSWTDVGKAARAIASIEGSSYRMYATALGVENILPMIEPDQ